MDKNFIFLYWDEPSWHKSEDGQKHQKDLQHNSSEDQLNSDTFCNQYHNKSKSSLKKNKKQ